MKNDDGSPVKDKDVTVTIDQGFLYKTDAAGDPVEEADPPTSGDFEHATSQTTVQPDAHRQRLRLVGHGA